MSRHTAQHESERLYAAETIDNELKTRLLLEREEIDLQLEEIRDRQRARRHTLGTLNPKRVGWGEV